MSAKVLSARVLIDTHVLTWAADDVRRLSPKSRAVLESLRNEVLVSAVSIFEITTKFRLGKLPAAEKLALDPVAVTSRLGFVSLPITLDHARRAGLLPGIHRDPFDRILIAQAQAEGIPLISNETLFDHYGVMRIW